MSAASEAFWTYPPAFRAAIKSIEHADTRHVLYAAMDHPSVVYSRLVQVPGDALLPSDNVLDTLRATYTRNKMETDTLPWDEAITLVLTNLQPVDYTEFMKGFRQ